MAAIASERPAAETTTQSGECGSEEVTTELRSEPYLECDCCCFSSVCSLVPVAECVAGGS